MLLILFLSNFTGTCIENHCRVGFVPYHDCQRKSGAQFEMTTLEGFEDTALHEAVRYSDAEDVKTALKSGCDPNQIGLYQWTPLHEAANNGDLCIVKLLLSFKGIFCCCDYFPFRINLIAQLTLRFCLTFLRPGPTIVHQF